MARLSTITGTSDTATITIAPTAACARRSSDAKR
jgi:hypothetical protein